MKKYPVLLLLFLGLCSMLLCPQRALAAGGFSGMRVIALGAPAVEIVCALGLEKALVARSSWDSFPPSIRALPDVGTPFQPDVERILGLAPDIILTDGRFGRLKERIDALGIEVFTVNAYNPEEVLPAVKRLAARLKQEERGADLAAELRSLRDVVQEALREMPPKERSCGIMLTGLGETYGVATESGCTLLEDAGAINLASGMGYPFPLLSKEWLVSMAPDFILVPVKAGVSMERSKAVFTGEMEALLQKKSRLFFLEEGMTFGLRSFLGMLYLAAELYPDRISQKEVARRKIRFMERFFPSSDQRDRTCP